MEPQSYMGGDAAPSASFEPFLANLSCPAGPAQTCPICFEVLTAWRPYQFSLYLITGILSGAANLLVAVVMLHRGLRYSCHWYMVAMVISDWLHSACLAVITQLIRTGGFSVNNGAAQCKGLYYAYFLCKSVSSWTVLTMSAEMCLSLCRPFHSPVRARVRAGVLVTIAEVCALAAAVSPRLLLVGPPTENTDRANMLCSVERHNHVFRYYALFETLALTYVLPVLANLIFSICTVCQLVVLNGRRRSQQTRALLLAALASAMFNAPYAAILALTQLGLFDVRSSWFHLGLCLYYAASAWACLGVFCNLAIFVAVNAAFRRSLVSLLACRTGKWRLS